jgi:hypothetical protein
MARITVEVKVAHLHHCVREATLWEVSIAFHEYKNVVFLNKFVHGFFKFWRHSCTHWRTSYASQQCWHCHLTEVGSSVVRDAICTRNQPIDTGFVCCCTEVLHPWEIAIYLQAAPRQATCLLCNLAQFDAQTRLLPRNPGEMTVMDLRQRLLT